MSQRCTFCSYVFMDVHILCVECDPKVPICIRCFSRGVESLTHKNDHQYSVVTTEFPLLCKKWTAAEELKLLDALLECGIGNWGDISKHVASKSAKECESHYLQHYIYAPQDLLKGIASEPSSIGSCQLAPVPYRVSGDPPRPLLCSQQQADMAGYMAARGDFAHEFDNFAEMDVTDLDFRHCEDALDRELQLAMVSIYQDRLRERARRKWLVRKHGLIHPHKTRQSWRRYSTTLGEATTALLGRFMQLLLPDDFDFLCEGLHSERLLCQQVQLLQESRRAGLTRLDSMALFKQCRRWRTAHRPKHTAFSELLAHIKNEASTQVWLHKQLVKDASVDASSPKALGRRKAPPLEIEGMPGYEKLNIRERELCAGLRIVPEMYLHFKGLLINEYEKLGSLRLANARAIIKIDVNKTRKLYDFLLAEGIVKKEIS
uniref:Transcriptional adapter n=1 Tax=Rhipicephalus pulchellus TaxID=72859 RepID=L7MAU8_RHIPC